MSVTAIIWSVLFVILVMLSFRRSVWGVALYMQTFFALPHMWWWGGPLAGYRWNFYAGIILLIAVIKDTAGTPPLKTTDQQRALKLLALMVANATFVHVVLSSNLEVSSTAYYLYLKFSVLVYVMMAAIRTPQDLRIVLWALTIGVGYIGCEVTFNNRGDIIAGRLEGVGAAGASSSNFLASLIVTVLPIMGGFFFTGNIKEKIVAALCIIVSLNTLILCNSRGAFLATIAAALILALAARGKARKRALTALGLGAVAAFLLLGNPKIVQRFMTTFSGAEERDDSAAGRLTLWKAALDMIVDYPLGAGGDGFKQQHGYKYTRDYGVERSVRAVHNGFLNDTCEWGIQGVACRLLFMLSGVIAAYKTIAYRSAHGDTNNVFFGACLFAAISGFLIASAFGDTLDSEWGYYVVTILITFSALYGPESDYADDSLIEDDVETDPDDELHEYVRQPQY